MKYGKWGMEGEEGGGANWKTRNGITLFGREMSGNVIAYNSSAFLSNFIVIIKGVHSFAENNTIKRNQKRASHHNRHHYHHIHHSLASFCRISFFVENARRKNYKEGSVEAFQLNEDNK